jgi:Leucine-rich repeat (LRR) protein
MKKLLLILLCFANDWVWATTYVPDDNFEAYLEANGMGNGIPNDDYVNTANINNVTYLDVYGQNIADLTGIEAFIALDTLDCLDNQLTSLDVSQNTALTELYCHYNQLTSLNVSQNTSLTALSCHYNQLTSLNVSQNTALTWLGCYDNQLTSLNVSQNTSLTALSCHSNQLTSLNVRNGNNTNFGFFAFGNPNLTCIDVDNVAYSTANWTIANNNIDSQSYFSNNCSGTAIEEQTTNKELLKVTDLLGRETKATNQLLFYIYNDGTVEKKVVIE